MAGLRAVNRPFSGPSADPRTHPDLLAGPDPRAPGSQASQAPEGGRSTLGASRLRLDYQRLTPRPIRPSPPRSERRRLSIGGPARRQRGPAKNLAYRRNAARLPPPRVARRNDLPPRRRTAGRLAHAAFRPGRTANGARKGPSPSPPRPADAPPACSPPVGGGSRIQLAAM